MNRTHSSRLTILFSLLAALALAAAMLALILSSAEAQEGDSRESSIPAKPTGLATTGSHDSVTLIWTDPGDDSITGYRILRREVLDNQDTQFQLLTQDTGSPQSTYTDRTVEPERSYVYRIIALSLQGESEASEVRSDTPPAPEDSQPKISERQTLSALSLSDGTLRPDFDSDTTEYRAAVEYDVEQITVTYTGETNSTVSFMTDGGADLSDADPATAGHQVNVDVGITEIVIRVTASDSTTEDYSLTIERDSPLFRGWTPTKDFNTLEGGEPLGMWSDGTTLWVADNDDDTLYAYTVATRARDPDKDIDLPSANNRPAGAWSDGTTIWVGDINDRKLYRLRAGRRRASGRHKRHHGPRDRSACGQWVSQRLVVRRDHALGGGPRLYHLRLHPGHQGPGLRQGHQCLFCTEQSCRNLVRRHHHVGGARSLDLRLRGGWRRTPERL